MSLPPLIEIIPPAESVQAQITVPGSKSITNRALILAALSDAETTLQGALWSEDTQVMVEGLQQLGFTLKVLPDDEEPCNRTIQVCGLNGNIPKGGTPEHPLDLFVGNAGTAARFLAPLVCLGKGSFRLHGSNRMHERPQAALFGALRELGYRVESSQDKLPVVIHGAGPLAGKCRVNIQESSQFASGLLLCAKWGGWSVEVIGESAEESPYVVMTSRLSEVFPTKGGPFEIEPDASSGSYFGAADWLLNGRENRKRISISRWPTSGWQVDARLMKLILAIAPQNPVEPGEAAARLHDASLSPPREISRERDLGDSIMAAAILAPFMGRVIRLIHLGRLRLQETERVSALRTELNRCGANVVEHEDTLTISPSGKLHGAEIETYDDHRMAMCFGILGLKVPGIKIRNPSCVKKTFPNFFQKLAGPTPDGLNVGILNAQTGKALELDELFAK